jgi:hypothetical protein
MSWVNGACGGNGSHSVVERQGEQFVAPVVRLGERRRRRDHTVSMRLHAAAAVDKQAHRHRRIFAGKQLGDLRSSVLENCEGVASQSANVPAASIRNRRVQNDEFATLEKSGRSWPDTGTGSSSNISSAPALAVRFANMGLIERCDALVARVTSRDNALRSRPAPYPQRRPGTQGQATDEGDSRQMTGCSRQRRTPHCRRRRGRR